MKYYVYIWFLKESGKVFYVGKGSGNRVTSLKDRNRHFKNIRAKCECDYRICKYFDNEEDAYAYELELGKYYKERGEAWCCYVLGMTNKFISNDIKKRISKSLSGHTAWNKGAKTPESVKEKIRIAHLGKKQSEEQKRKRSESLLNHSVSDETKRKISDAKKGDRNPMFGKRRSQLSILKQIDKMKGHKTSLDTKIKIGKANGKQVAKMDVNSDRIIDTYFSVSDAAKQNSISASGIFKVCRGLRNVSHGYKWAYI